MPRVILRNDGAELPRLCTQAPGGARECSSKYCTGALRTAEIRS